MALSKFPARNFPNAVVVCMCGCVFIWFCDFYTFSADLPDCCKNFLGPRGGTYNLFTVVLQSLCVVLQDLTDIVVQSKLIISNNVR
jgi:hypothetical protein